MTKIKICGIRRIQDIKNVNTLLPEYIGFVFAQKSKRHIDLNSASRLRDSLDDRIQVVGVFADAPINQVDEYLKSEVIQIAQLHGDENEDYIKRLRERTNAKIVKAFTIRTSDDLAKALNSPADMVLLDNGGGTGKTFDWSIIENMPRKFFLAGGLTPENVGESIAITDPFAVDVSSGVETGGKKDIIKMKAFVENVRNIHTGRT